MYTILSNLKKFLIMKEAEAVNEKLSTDYVTLLDNNYPNCFKTKLGEPPFVLYYKGDISLLNNKDFRKLSIVGSRRCSKYGVESVKQIISSLPKDYIIISGLAKGIDSIAHKTALECGLKTIAVLGSGIDYIYPEENLTLYNDIILNRGLILSEYPNHVSPKKDNFIFRNRLVASLGEFLLIGEAYSHSGTQTTITYALQCGNSVGCIPYPINTDSLCNTFIKEGAYLIDSSKEIVNIMNNEGNSYR